MVGNFVSVSVSVCRVCVWGGRRLAFIRGALAWFVGVHWFVCPFAIPHRRTTSLFAPSQGALLPTSTPGPTSEDSFKCAESGCNPTRGHPAPPLPEQPTDHCSALSSSHSLGTGLLAIAGHSLRGPESLSQPQGRGGQRPSLGLRLLRASHSRCPLCHLSTNAQACLEAPGPKFGAVSDGSSHLPLAAC